MYRIQNFLTEMKQRCRQLRNDRRHTSHYTSDDNGVIKLTLRLLMSYIYIYVYGAPSKARNANVVYIWTYVWQR